MAVKEIPNNLFFNNIKNIINSGSSVELRIKGNSMHPTLLNGKHKVVLVPYKKQYLRVGVIALFEYRGKCILHRLQFVDGDQLIFQGDNMPYVKECIKEENIIAVVEFIITPLGRVIDCKTQWFFIRNRLWRPIRKYNLILVRGAKRFLYRAFNFIN